MSGNRGVSPLESDLSEKFRRLVEVGLALTSERDVSVLLGRILFEARRFTGAEAGTLYLVTPDGKLQFSVVQNDKLGHSEVLVGNGSQPITIEISPTSIAGLVAGTGSTLNIPDVHDLPESCGFQFDSSFDLKTGYCSRSMLVVPMKTPDGHITGVIQLINAGRPGTDEGTTFSKENEELVLCLASQAAVALNNARLTSELQLAYSEAIHRLGRAAEFRDHDTGEHIERVSRYAAAIAEAMKFPPAEVSKILLASTLHDIGKLAIPDCILQKPSGLTDEEYAEMKRHAELGADILARSENPTMHLAAEIALSHHEKWDGTGYPRGLKSDEIPVSGQICAVADVFDALSSARCYKKPMSLEEACDFIRTQTGHHFSPQVVEAFFGVIDKIAKIQKEFST